MSESRTHHPMSLPRQHTAMVVIDVQERLFPAMDADHREEVMRNIKVLTTAAHRLRVPLFATEQYPKGLGHILQPGQLAAGHGPAPSVLRGPAAHRIRPRPPPGPGRRREMPRARAPHP